MAGWLNDAVFSIRMTVRGMLSPVSVGALALVECEGKIVLIRQSYVPGWRLPGGGVGYGEPPATAVMRELKEEIGLTHAAPPEMFGVYTRPCWPATNLVVLYRVREAQFAFKPNLEVRACQLADPVAPPAGTVPPARRRLAELIGTAPQSLYW